MDQLETMTCSRCGGSGHFSYNQIHGTRCYGCNGTGKKYTKRGAAAAKFLSDLRSIPAEQFKVGDLILYQGISHSKFVRITSVEVSRAKDQGCYSGDGEYQQVKIQCEGGYGAYYRPGNLVRKGCGAEMKSEQLRQALAFQATLTKNGTPRKRAT
ncbi:hypothetical protein [Paraburkholderia sacchari]|uniref:hypothetical protein n=1 Tax=Paraburkholderia sacchari TaxID=159450 RepID=UPI0005435820|nr:hypothetical protein [Paraburkholderia sacchari]NLP65551.1 hypothetical protein [Paraburkholderia sacchari]